VGNVSAHIAVAEVSKAQPNKGPAGWNEYKSVEVTQGALDKLRADEAASAQRFKET